MCYTVIVVTHACEENQDHLIQANLCWRQCLTQSIDSRDVDVWNRICQDTDFAQVLIHCDTMIKVPSKTCPVCRQQSEGEPTGKLKDIDSSGAVEHEESEGHEDDELAHDADDEYSDQEEMGKGEQNKANNDFTRKEHVKELQAEISKCEWHARGFCKNMREVEQRAPVYGDQWTVPTSRLELFKLVKSIAILRIDIEDTLHFGRIDRTWEEDLTFKQRAMVIRNAIEISDFMDPFGTFYYGNQQSDQQAQELEAECQPPKAFPKGLEDFENSIVSAGTSVSCEAYAEPEEGHEEDE